MDPAVLFADEPTGNLDDETAEQIVELLDRINKQGTTVIMSTHDIGLVKRMKKRTIELEAGALTGDSDPKQKKQEEEKKPE